MDHDDKVFISRRRMLRRIFYGLVCVAVPLLVRVVLHAPHGIDAVGAQASHGLTPGRDGRWGSATATVDWCEENYVTWHVAELFNVLSSLVLIVHGVWGMVRHSWAERRFLLAFAGFCVVGMGSAAFHGTLWRSMQLADELPMVWINSIFIYIVITCRDPRNKVRWGLVAALVVGTVLATLAIVFLDTDDQNIFLLCYGSGVVFEVVKNQSLDAEYNNNERDPATGELRRPWAKRMLMMDTAIVIYGAAFVSWLLDRNFCAYLRPLHLHSFWHLGASMGTFCAVLNWLWLRERAAATGGKVPVVKGMLPLPTVQVVEAAGKQD